MVTKRFHTRFPFAAMEAAEWVYLVHQWLLSEISDIGISQIFFPKEVREEKERGSYRFFLSGGVRIWIYQERHQGHYGEEWNLVSIRATWPDDGEKVWGPDDFWPDLCRFHPNKVNK